MKRGSRKRMSLQQKKIPGTPWRIITQPLVFQLYCLRCEWTYSFRKIMDWPATDPPTQANEQGQWGNFPRDKISRHYPGNGMSHKLLQKLQPPPPKSSRITSTSTKWANNQRASCKSSRSMKCNWKKKLFSHNHHFLLTPALCMSTY